MREASVFGFIFIIILWVVVFRVLFIVVGGMRGKK